MIHTNSIDLHEHKRPAPGAPTVSWDDPQLKRVTRLRLISDPGFPLWDLSYVWGELKDGTKVNVRVPFDQLPKRALKRQIVAEAQTAGVFAKGLGLLDSDVISLLS